MQDQVWESVPAIVLRNMRYSKFEISLLCQRWVMLEDLKSCRGVARETRLDETFENNQNNNYYRAQKRRLVLSILNFWLNMLATDVHST